MNNLKNLDYKKIVHIVAWGITIAFIFGISYLSIHTGMEAEPVRKLVAACAPFGFAFLAVNSALKRDYQAMTICILFTLLMIQV